MSQKLFCRVCSHEVKPTDKFCSSCGAEIISEPVLSVPVEEKISTMLRCTLCGHQNPGGAAFCESCGNALPSQKKNKPQSESAKTATEHAAAKSLGIFQSWKLTVGMAIALIVVLVVAKYRHSNDETPTEPAMPAVQGAVVEQIESLQKAVDANPNDARATLMLANRLQDARFFPRAITMYERYLKLNPSDVDAQVDLGVTYFDLALVDSSHQQENLHVAQHLMEQAIQRAPKHQLAYFNLGIISLHTGNMEKANEWFKKTAAIDSTTEVGRKAHTLLNQHTFNQP